MTGGLETFLVGKPLACVMRSWTNARARMMSVPGSKMSRMDDRPVTDCERMVLSHGTPCNSSSMGTVTSDSTSAADRPSDSVWISTYGGANSGKASTGTSRSRTNPPHSSAAATMSTTNLSFKLDSTIQRIMVGGPFPLFWYTGQQAPGSFEPTPAVQSSSFAPAPRDL